MQNMADSSHQFLSRYVTCGKTRAEPNSSDHSLHTHSLTVYPALLFSSHGKPTDTGTFIRMQPSSASLRWMNWISVGIFQFWTPTISSHWRIASIVWTLANKTRVPLPSNLCLCFLPLHCNPLCSECVFFTGPGLRSLSSKTWWSFTLRPTSHVTVSSISVTLNPAWNQISITYSVWQQKS